MKRWLTSTFVVLLAGVSGYGQIEIPGVPPETLGTDGPLEVTDALQIDLRLAPTGSWTDPGGDVNGDGLGDGVYDPLLHAVVFKYAGVSIYSYYARSVTFINHPSNASVVWLVDGDVSITGGCDVKLNGQGTQGSAAFAQPGPGGFRGARAALGPTLGSGGFGPGGGPFENGVCYGAGSHSTTGVVSGSCEAAPTYGNAFVLPLQGGSGAGHTGGTGGGAGGGAILIVATGEISIGGGGIVANGGSSSYGAGGSGGAIRLIADSITGSSPLSATGAGGYYTGVYGGAGRIFMQANEITYTGAGNPTATQTDFLGSPYYLWPPESGDDAAPTVTPVKLVVDGVDVMIPADPEARLDFPLADVSFDTADTVELHISAANMPTAWTVVARIVAKSGDSFTATADYISGDDLASEWIVHDLELPRGFGAVQVRAFEPPDP